MPLLAQEIRGKTIRQVDADFEPDDYKSPPRKKNDLLIGLLVLLAIGLACTLLMLWSTGKLEF